MVAKAAPSCCSRDQDAPSERFRRDREARLDALSEAESDARHELMKAAPASTAGVTALLRYVLFYQSNGMMLEDILDLRVLAKAIAKIKI
jgi:hypothetical protein